MAIKFASSEITQHCVNFKLNNDTVSIALTKDNTTGIWFFSILKGKRLSVEDLIEICNYIYSKEIIDEHDIIVLEFRVGERTYIRGKEKVVTSILSAIEVKLVDKKEK